MRDAWRGKKGVRASLACHFTQVSSSVQGFATRDDGAPSISSEDKLTSDIPQLECDIDTVDDELPEVEVHADGGLVQVGEAIGDGAAAVGYRADTQIPFRWDGSVASKGYAAAMRCR